MLTVAIISTVMFALLTYSGIKQSQRIQELNGQVYRKEAILKTTKDMLWERIIPNQQFPYADMERLLERLTDETNQSVRQMYRKALTGKD